MNQSTRAILWNVGDGLAIAAYVVLGLSVLVMLWGVIGHVRSWRRGASAYPIREVPRRIGDALVYAVAQVRIFGDRGAGVMHAGIFWGMLGLLLATFLVALQHDFGLDILRGGFYVVFKVMANTAGLLLIAGCLLGLWRRVARPVARLEKRARDIWLLVLLLALAVEGFLVEGLRILGTGALGSEHYSYPGWILAELFSLPGVSGTGLTVAHRVLWVAHALTAVGFIVLIPYSKLAHMLGSSAAIFLRSYEPRGAFRLVDRETPPVKPLAAESLSWRELLDGSACTHCGRCEAACPATITGKPLSPRSMVLKAGPSTRGVSNGDRVVTDDEIWSCTTCRACLEECPVFLEPMGTVVGFRRSLIDSGRVEPTLARGLESTQALGNPWGYAPTQRLDWAFNVRTRLAADGGAGDLLYWVGCAGAHEPDGQVIARSVVRLLVAAEVPFTVLGGQESCCGEPVRRVGEEVLFQELAEKNIALMREHGVRRIVTHCPHCFNMLKHEYAQVGGSFEVLHHSELLNELVRSGRLTPVRELGGPLAYHDPCYLGRYNDLYEPPRDLLRSIPNVELTSVRRERGQSFCCGGGGGQMWMSLNLGSRVNYQRFQDFKDVDAQRIATACTNCKIMMNDAASYEGLQEKVKVKDVAEWLADSIGIGEGT